MTEHNGRMTKVAVHGSYFANNFGDTLLIKLMCDRVARLVGRANVYLAVDGSQAEQESIGYPVVSEEECKNISHLVFAGGGYFGEPNTGYWAKRRWERRNRKRHIDWVKRFSNAKIAAFGVGVGPLSNPIFRRSVRRLFDRMEVIVVRDSESLKFLESYGFKPKTVYEAVDLALTVGFSNGEYCISHAQRPRKIGLHIGNLSVAEIRLIINTILSSGLATGLEDIDTIFDSRNARKLKARYREALEGLSSSIAPTFIDYTNVDNFLDRLHEYEVVITSKLHVGIVTTSIGGKVISVPRHQKTARFYKQLGLEQFCIDRSALNEKSLSNQLENLDSYKFDHVLVQAKLNKLLSSIDEFINS